MAGKRLEFEDLNFRVPDQVELDSQRIFDEARKQIKSAYLAGMKDERVRIVGILRAALCDSRYLVDHLPQDATVARSALAGQATALSVMIDSIA